MNIQETATHLQRLNQPFDVIIWKNGSEQTLYTNCAPTNVEGLLNEVVSTHKPERLIIQERKRNGSVNVKTNMHEVSLGGLAPQYPVLSGYSGQSPTSVQNIPQDFKDYMISDLKQKLEKAEKKLEQFEKENYELKTERDNLNLELKTKDKEFELAQKETELEHTGGLSGIIETVSTNPALANIAAVAIGRLMGIDPMQQPEIQESNINGAPEQANVPDLNRKVAGFVSEWINKQDEQLTLSFYELMKLIASDTDLIFEIIANHKEQSNE